MWMCGSSSVKRVRKLKLSPMASGNRPSTAVKAVSSTGRKRVFPAVTKASRLSAMGMMRSSGRPSLRALRSKSRRAKSMSTMALFTTTPISEMMPSIVISTMKSMRNTTSPRKTPMVLKSTVLITTMG